MKTGIKTVGNVNVAKMKYPSFLIMQYIFLPFHCLLFLRMFSSLFKLVAPAFFTA